MTATSLLLISPSPLSTKSDEINKPNGYKILMKSSSVRLRLDNLPTRVQQYFNFTPDKPSPTRVQQYFNFTPSDKPSEFITVLSSDIQKVIRKTHCSVNFISDDIQPPLLQLISKDDTSNVNKSLRKYGINLQGKTRVKVIEFSSNIDDNMFRVRVKQAEDFLQADHFVVIIIKLKHLKKLLSKKNIQSTTTKADGGEQQLRNLGKVEYEKNVAKYARIFEGIPYCKVHIIDRPNVLNIVMTLERIKIN
uniref:Band 7 domain-containing protein n=1 Tax=Schistosoma haematobium TaxID=6185 RepID=A0A095A3A3_SCHHA